MTCFHGCLAFLHRHFHHNLLPHILSTCVSAVNSSPCPGVVPQSLNFSSQPLRLLVDLHPCPGNVWLHKDCLILIPFRVREISCFTLSLKCSSSDSDNCPNVGIGLLFQFPHPLRAGPILLTLLFSPLAPSSYRVLHESIYFSPTGQVLLSTLSWCSACTSVFEGVFLMYRGERYTPHPPTPLPSCSLPGSFLNAIF